MVFHFFGHTSHERTARINLQQLRLILRAVLKNGLKSLGYFSRDFRCQRLSSFVAAGDVDNVCKLSGRGATCHVAEKEGRLGGPR